MLSCERLLKMMTYDTQHVHVLFIIGFARKDLAYLEQIPNAFFVSRCLFKSSCTLIKQLLLDRDLYRGDVCYDFL